MNTKHRLPVHNLPGESVRELEAFVRLGGNPVLEYYARGTDKFRCFETNTGLCVASGFRAQPDRPYWRVVCHWDQDQASSTRLRPEAQLYIHDAFSHWIRRWKKNKDF